MGNFVKVASTADLLPGTCISAEADGLPIALFNVNGEIHATDNACAHQGGPLGEGFLEDKVVTCPWHGWQFDVTTGACAASPDITVPKYNVKVEGDDILVEIDS